MGLKIKIFDYSEDSLSILPPPQPNFVQPWTLFILLCNNLMTICGVSHMITPCYINIPPTDFSYFGHCISSTRNSVFPSDHTILFFVLLSSVEWHHSWQNKMARCFVFPSLTKFKYIYFNFKEIACLFSFSDLSILVKSIYWFKMNSLMGNLK